MIRANQRHVWTDDHQEQFRAAERLIDRAIQDADGDELTVDVSSATKSGRVLKALCVSYGENGWIAEDVSGDQRDHGPFLRLRVAPPPSSGPG